ncbi:hypothetical protein RFI_18461, partial [Reticulomyxa filosa]
GFNGVCDLDNIVAGNATESIVQLCEQNSDDSLKRQDMFIHSPWRLESAVAEINDLRYIGVWQPGLSPPWQDDPFLRTDHALYQNARKLTFLRKSCRALRRGDIYFRQADYLNGGLLIYSRIDWQYGIEIVVALNTNNNNGAVLPAQIVIDSSLNTVNGAKYYNVLDLSIVGYVGVSSNPQQSFLYVNNPVVDMYANGYVIFVREDQIGAFNDQMGIAPCLQ